MANTFTIAVTGQSLIKHDIRGVETPGFVRVRELLGQADFAFTNFESTILGSHGGWPFKGAVFGCSQPVVLDALQAMGIHGLSLSNNHAFDLGPSGILSPLRKSKGAACFMPISGNTSSRVSSSSLPWRSIASGCRAAAPNLQALSPIMPR